MATSEETREPVAIAESASLEWPPSGPAAVQALSRAADTLEDALLQAGWKPLPPGEAWYAKRFAWRAAQERPQERTPSAADGGQPEDADGHPKGSRFARRAAWPDDTDGLWRCELEWQAGYVNSRFAAVLHRPGRRRGQQIAGSATYKWMLMADPDPQVSEYRAEVERLTSALEEARWERISDGSSWYSRRFVWRYSSPPPEHLELTPAANVSGGEADD